MTVLALYVPKPEELTGSIALLIFVYLVLCGLAFLMKLSVPMAAIALFVGAALALAPDVLPLRHADLHNYGDMAREQSSTEYSDSFFAITSYMYVGRGKLVAIAGMVAGFGATVVFHAIKKRKCRSDEDQRKRREGTNQD
ncbi:hypothetical protein Pan258_11700 [Symmachiella dynata]|uniref:hypothetical protein n=1 Tax=Symmachiella dynata TaxID=2527995 RepID=UPI001189D87F|nr:hypothetical protein [Symmachiella dynata]QDT47139.1 hypothetical protein Pan258_11700 [Symmachiella dynata]